MLNGYIAIWKGKRIEVHAETSYKAQQLAAKQFGKYARSYDITIMLAEKDGQPVTHSTASL